MTVIQVEIIFDPASAWCYIGKRRLDQAIAIHRKTYPGGRTDTFSITWRPYYLHALERPIDVTEEKSAALEQRVRQVGESVGIKFTQARKIGPTRDAHRLISLAQRQCSAEILNMLVDKIFEAYHELDLDISSKDTLTRLATDTGVDEAETVAMLNSSTDVKSIDNEAKLNREILNGAPVPHFNIQNHKLDGAQDIWNFLVIFGNIKKKEEEFDASDDDDE